MDSLNSLVVRATAGLVILLLVYKLSRVGMRPKHFPPGPPALPIIGNLHQFPLKDFHLQFQKWTEQYGPVISLKLGTQTLVLLGTASATRDLLEKRSSIHSTRMETMFREFEGNDLNIAFRPYDNLWRRQRKVYHVRLNAKLANNYLPYQYFETRQLLHELLENPAEYRHSLERFTISIGSTIAYGRRMPSADVPEVKTLMEWFRRAIMAGASLAIADWWPILKPAIRVLPSSINPIKRQLEELHDMEVGLWKKLTNITREHLESGRFYPSLCRDMLVNLKTSQKDALSEEEIWYNAGHAWAAATDTQSNTLLGFVKAMVLFPSAQEKAQKEIDLVVGPDRMPEWTDRPSLPYVRGCAEETLRWAPTTVTGGPMPHAASKDDVYLGYTIPAGAGVMNCAWTINNDPEIFPNPREFNPLRFAEQDSVVEGFGISQNYDKRPHMTFGAGRRVCPGYHVAERTLFITMARLLWAFDFRPKVDENGNKIPVDSDAMTTGLVVGPAPFECDIVPRSAERANIIRKYYEESEESLDVEGNYKEEFFKLHWAGKDVN